MKSIFESLRMQLHERLTSPLFGAFTAAWIAWNHAYLFIMFSDTPISIRLVMAENVCFPTRLSVVLRGAVYPFISSILFIIIYPIISKYVYEYWLKRQREEKAIRDTIEGQTLLTIEDTRKFYTKMAAFEDKYEDKMMSQATTIENLQKELATINETRNLQDGAEKQMIVALKNERDELQKEVARLTSTPTPSPSDMQIKNPKLTPISPSGLRAVELLCTGPNPMDRTELLKRFSNSTIEAQFHLDEAVDSQAIHETSSGWYSLTKLGRRIGVERGLTKNLTALSA